MKEQNAHILFVDDDREFLDAMSDMFGALSDGAWKIQTADSCDAATEILKSGEIKLVVLDINMPVLDGIQFSGMIRRRHPGLKIAMLTAYASEEKRAAAFAAGAELFVEKPHSPEGMKAVFIMLGELLHWSPRAGFQGVLRSVNLQDVIQMECAGRNSSIIEICNDEILGRIYIEDGNLIHAAAGDWMGERALHKLLSLPGGSFELVSFEPPQQRTLNAPWELLMAEATRKVELAAPKMEATKNSGSTAKNSTHLVSEILICTGNGERLYADGCADANSRMQFLLAVAQQAAVLDKICPLGHFDRLEIQFAAARTIAQAREDRLIYVTVKEVA